MVAGGDATAAASFPTIMPSASHLPPRNIEGRRAGPQHGTVKDLLGCSCDTAAVGVL
jgi:hypothetical protein